MKLNRQVYLFLTLIACLVSNPTSFGQEQEFDLERELKNLYLPPTSFRCQQLIDQRDHKIKFKQRMNSLLARTEQALKNSSERQESTRKKLQFTKNEIESNLVSTQETLRSLEEKIVRSGCPGITL